MGESRDFVSLDWVQEDIQQSLLDAQTNIENYLAGSSEKESLEACYEAIHQVHGSLQMVGISSAMALTKPLEQIVNQLLKKETAPSDEVHTAIAQAIVFLPAYLARIQQDGVETPNLVVQPINDLKRCLNEELLPENNSFLPNLGPQRPAASADQIAEFRSEDEGPLRKLRQVYQFALIGLIRSEDVRSNYSRAANVISRFQRLCKGSRIGQLWDISAALLEGLLNGAIEPSATSLEYLRGTEKYIKRLIESGEQILDESPDPDLLTGMLHLISLAQTNSPHIRAITDEYQLGFSDTAEPELIAAPDRGTVKSVVGALNDELLRIKDTIDLYVRNEVKDNIDLGGLQPSLRKIASTLIMLNLDAPCLVIQEQLETLSKYSAESKQIPDEALLSIAESLLYVEAELQTLVDRVSNVEGGVSAQARVAQDVVLKECLVGLQQAKQAIDDFIAAEHDFELVRTVPNTLRSIHGGLAMISATTPSQLSFSVAKYIEDDVLAREQFPQGGVMDNIANVVAAVEYYLENKINSREVDAAVLDQAKSAIAGLGYPIEQSAGIISEDEAQDVAGFELEETTVAETTFEEIGTFELELNTELTIDESEPPATGLADLEIESDSAVAPEGIEEPDSSDQDAEEPASFVDEEILEVFAEEAEEVIAAIHENLVPLSSNYSDKHALTEMRRSFHTLKGSGRMVGAEIIGELAWAVEDMLNHVLEGAISVSDPMLGLITRSTEAMPQLMAQFSSGGHLNVNVKELTDLALAITEGSFEDHGQGAESEEQPDTPSAQPISDIEAEVPAEPATAEEPDSNELVDVFSQESKDHIAVIQRFIDTIEDSEAPAPLTEDLFRALHTLKGSASMASVESVATIASATETFLLAMHERNMSADKAILALLNTSKNLLTAAVNNLNTAEQVEVDGIEEFVNDLNELANALREPTDNSAQINSELRTHFLGKGAECVLLAEKSFDLWAAKGAKSNSQSVSEISSQLETVSSLSVGKELELVGSLAETMHRAYAAIASTPNIDSISKEFEKVLAGAHEGLLDRVDQIAAHQPISDIEQLTSAINTGIEAHSTASDKQELLPTESTTELNNAEIDLTPNPSADQNEIDIDPELLEIFLEEADEIFDAISQAKHSWLEEAGGKGSVDELQRALHTLKGSSRMVGISPIGNLSHELESIYERLNAGQIKVSPELVVLIHACDDQLVDMVSAAKNNQRCPSGEKLITKIQSLNFGTNDARLEEPKTKQEVASDIPAEKPDTSGESIADSPIVDYDTLAADLLKRFSSCINYLNSKQCKTTKALKDLTEITESLKVESYAAGVHQVGDLSQVFLEILANLKPVELSKSAVKSDLQDWLERFKTSFGEAQFESDSQPEEQFVVSAAKRKPEPSKAAATVQDNIRVSSALLESLVDLAGETSVSRARVEQQVSNFGFAIDEMGATIERLREQLRRMEMETEAQVLFRQEREGPTHEGFDPLEMDRYSRMQELSRSLVESVSDLFDLKDTLRDRARYTDNLLLQQSRINTELQEGLMKTRMEPFSRLVPRLRRIVRQVSSELNKDVDVQFRNVDTEIDRSLLEHMTAPLEHMLRNAVDHGIESAAQRKKQGKNEQGAVALSIDRDGADILILLEDDGAGIDINRVREKAIERGLMYPEAQLIDQDILQFILHAGFSTAKSVTKISGRGVGLDVVHSEIKQMGGSIQIESESGKGTRFAIRIPFTVSVSRALMVSVGENSYALPLGTIEGVVRVSPYELEEYYKEDAPDFVYAGQSYELRYLGDYLGHPRNLTLQNQGLPLPVVLIHANNHTAAIQVDSITGSREIVVKSLGPQLSSLPGMSGATILGDGSVVLILDMPGMIREIAATHGMRRDYFEQSPVSTSTRQGALKIMVVDDSVTVRKVASRILERNDMAVILAKDGVEAMTKLQDIVPDVILLDIEMPRMDGFELASLVKHDQRLQNVPVIMVSSRTGQKHRDRAAEIGVNHFMGKPFQEDELLAAISEHTNVQLKASS